MHMEDQTKNHPPGHEVHGPHVCHKCGWTFPNPHPSAKHRRAHKKVCGKLDGFKIPEEKAHFALSDDDDHLSDDDHKKVEETRNNEKGSGRFRRQESNRSEEEEFSDAVTEFTDTGANSAIVETVVVAGAAEPDLKAIASANIIEPANNSTHGSQVQSPQALKSLADQLESDTQFQDHASITTMGLISNSVSDKVGESLTGELTEGRNGSPSFIPSVKPEAPENLHAENSQIGENVESMAFIGQDADTKCDADGSLSTMADSSSKIASESETDVKVQKMDGFKAEAISSDVTDASTIITADTIPMDGAVDSKEEENNAWGQKMSKNKLSPDTSSHSVDVEAVEHMDGALVDTAQVGADCAHKVDNECSRDNVEGCNINEVNENLPALSEPAHMPVEEHSEMMVNDCKDHEPVKSEISRTLDCGEAIREMKVKSPVSEETQSGFLSSKSGESVNVSSSAMQVLEDNHQLEGTGSKSVIEEVSVEFETDISEAKDTISEGLESHGLETFLDATSRDVTYRDTEKSQMVCSLKDEEPHYPQQDLSHNILPETFMVVAAGRGTTVSPTDAAVHEATNAVSGHGDGNGYDVVHEEARIDNSDTAGNCIRGGDTDENSTTNTKDAPEAASCLSESEKGLQETESTLLDAVVDSSGMGIITSHLENITEPPSDPQDCQDENLQESSKELEVSRSIDPSSVSKTEVQVEVESIGADSGVAEIPHEETLNHSSELGLFHSGAENHISKSMPSAVDTGSCVLSSGRVEDNSTKGFGEGDASDIHSESLQEEGNNNLLKQKSDASAVVPPDASIDSISQTDSVEGCWGSVSDGLASSLRDATDAPPIPAAEALPETDNQVSKEEAQVADLNRRGASEEHRSGNNDIFEPPSFMTLVQPNNGNNQQSASEIQTAQDLQQPQSSSSQPGWFPTLTHVVNESPGRKKNEEIIAKVVNWSSGKSHTPLKNLLVEANLESKQKASNTQSHTIPPAQKDNASAAQDNGVLAKTLPPMTAPELSTAHSAKTNTEKEWNSPARLPESREKRKARGKAYWVPFVCCSSVN